MSKGYHAQITKDKCNSKYNIVLLNFIEGNPKGIFLDNFLTMIQY